MPAGHCYRSRPDAAPLAASGRAEHPFSSGTIDWPAHRSVRADRRFALSAWLRTVTAAGGGASWAVRLTVAAARRNCC